MKKLSVIIVSHNAPEYLAGTLYSLTRALSEVNGEIIVVDNASEALPVKSLEEVFPEIKFITLESNLGFAAANNVGWRAACGEFILFLNPDCLLHPDSVRVMLETLESHSRVGAVGPMLLNEDGTFQRASRRRVPTIWSSLFHLSGLSSRFPKLTHLDRYSMGDIPETDRSGAEVLSGAAMMVRRRILEEIGGWDERFFLYAEDIDLSIRIREAGYQLVYLPEAQILHFKGKSSAASMHIRNKYFFRSMGLFAEKYYTLQPLKLMVIKAFSQVLANTVSVTGILKCHKVVLPLVALTCLYPSVHPGGRSVIRILCRTILFLSGLLAGKRMLRRLRHGNPQELIFPDNGNPETARSIEKQYRKEISAGSRIRIASVIHYKFETRKDGTVPFRSLERFGKR